MDLRVYYQKIRKIEAGLSEPHVVIVSRDTPDGGKAGVKNDVPRALAARLIAEEKADLASPEQTAQFRAEAEARWKESKRAAEPEEPPYRAPRSRVRPQGKA
jgi:hypothetical protein